MKIHAVESSEGPALCGAKVDQSFFPEQEKAKTSKCKECSKKAGERKLIWLAEA